MFTQRFSSTPLGARLARRLTLHQLHGWGIPHGTRISDSAALIVAELCANAATHGRVPGRDSELRLTLGEDVLRIEVSDTRGEKRPPGPGEVTAPPTLSETRRGLLLVDTLADRWAVLDRAPVGETVRAELDLPH
ncbi:ATP-binding protein [Streptomyces sp. NA02950]|uniref:ATP-binding protein n=1 Tax=Streptomyces sp. NA02950 TaxID=2742137 RepID=UPI00159176AB|nr:ATP-binding protein [Streptomyces sp. NA02950]QKV92107.1 ATP-binding protein [Streptomyces sp. NA02950]